MSGKSIIGGKMNGGTAGGVHDRLTISTGGRSPEGLGVLGVEIGGTIGGIVVDGVVYVGVSAPPGSGHPGSG